MEALEVKRILTRKDGVKYIIIPKHSQLQGGELVKIIRMEVKD